MNTTLNRIKRLSLIGLFAITMAPLFSQNRNDTLPVYNSDIIRRYGRSITLPVNEKVRIQTKIKQLVDSCLITMILRQESSEQFDPQMIEKFRSFFDEQVLIKNINAIPNFYQPRPCLDTTVYPGYYTVQDYCDSAQMWFDFIDIYKQSDIVAHDFFYKFRGDRYTYAQVSIEFSSRSRIECDGRVDTSFNLNFWFKLSKQKIISQTGEELPQQYKLRFLEIQPAIEVIIPDTAKYKNRWGLS